jgi:hypothetical protein
MTAILLGKIYFQYMVFFFFTSFERLFVSYHRACGMSNMTGTICEAGAGDPSGAPEHTRGF